MIRNVFFMCLCFSAVLFSFSCKPSKPPVHSLVKKWETDTVFKTPESVLYNKDSNILYVSNINGNDVWAMDGNGSIAKIGADGKNIVTDWVTGLNGPKGMGIYKGKLYAADVTEIVVINIQTRTIEKKITVAGAKGLNDITIDKDGVLYVSDSEGGKIFTIKNDVATILLSDVKAPNGLIATADGLYMLESGTLYKINADKSTTKIVGGMKGADGVENISGKDFIVSASGGIPYYIFAAGTKEKLSDGTTNPITSADMGIDAATRTIFIPTFERNTVAAYEVK